MENLRHSPENEGGWHASSRAVNPYSFRSSYFAKTSSGLFHTSVEDTAWESGHLDRPLKAHWVERNQLLGKRCMDGLQGKKEVKRLHQRTRETVFHEKRTTKKLSGLEWVG